MTLSFSEKQRVIALDIGAYNIKVVEGKENKKGVIIDKYFTIRTPTGVLEDGSIVDKDLLHYIISEELKKKKVKTKNVYLTVNSSKILTREITIPKVDEDDIESFLKFQIEEYIPVSMDKYIIQHKVLETFYEDNIEKMNLLIIAIPKDMVEDYFDLLKSLNLNPLVMDYQPNSIAKLIQYSSLINNTYPTEDITFANIDIGYDSTKISIIKNGNILVSRIIEVGGSYIDQSILNFNETSFEEIEDEKLKIEDINRADKDSNRHTVTDIIRTSMVLLSEKIDMVFRYYLSRRPDNTINLILITGGVSNIKGLDNMFSNIFNIPAISIKTLDNVDFKGNFSDYANSIGTIIRTSGV